MDALTYLKDHVSLFAGLTDEQLTPLAVVAEVANYNKGSTILFKGATVDHLQIVCVGSAAVFVKPPNKPIVQVATLNPGDVFGETSILELGVAGATIKADSDGTVILTIPQEAFRGLLSGSPEFVARVQALIAARRGPGPTAPGS